MVCEECGGSINGGHIGTVAAAGKVNGDYQVLCHDCYQEAVNNLKDQS